MPASDPSLVASLLAARAAIDSVLVALSEEAREGQETPPEDAQPAQAAGPCQHQNRNDLKSFGSVEHWICADCGYEYRR